MLEKNLCRHAVGGRPDQSLGIRLLFTGQHRVQSKHLGKKKKNEFDMLEQTLVQA